MKTTDGTKLFCLRTTLLLVKLLMTYVAVRSFFCQRLAILTHTRNQDLHKILVKTLPPGVRLTVIFDSCHSGTAMDLPYVYNERGCIEAPGMVSTLSYKKGKKMKKMKMKKMKEGKKGKKKDKKGHGAADMSGVPLKAGTSMADVIMFSGCRDDQTSADTSFAGTNNLVSVSPFANVVQRFRPNGSHVVRVHDHAGQEAAVELPGAPREHASDPQLGREEVHPDPADVDRPAHGHVPDVHHVSAYFSPRRGTSYPRAARASSHFVSTFHHFPLPLLPSL
jgi:hypothetical protein